jgi:hypothetical protein
MLQRSLAFLQTGGLRVHSPAVAPQVEEHDVGRSMDLAFGIGGAHRAIRRKDPAGLVRPRGQVNRTVAVGGADKLLRAGGQSLITRAGQARAGLRRPDAKYRRVKL